MHTNKAPHIHTSSRMSISGRRYSTTARATRMRWPPERYRTGSTARVPTMPKLDKNERCAVSSWRVSASKKVQLRQLKNSRPSEIHSRPSEIHCVRKLCLQWECEETHSIAENIRKQIYFTPCNPSPGSCRPTEEVSSWGMRRICSCKKWRKNNDRWLNW